MSPSATLVKIAQPEINKQKDKRERNTLKRINIGSTSYSQIMLLLLLRPTLYIFNNPLIRLNGLVLKHNTDF